MTTQFNPKGVLFWASMFGLATCFAVHSDRGILSFGILGICIFLFG